MRYDTEVLFVKEVEGGYSPELGKWVQESKKVTSQMANVTDLGAEKSRLFFGEVRNFHKVIRLRNPYLESWSYAVISEREYTEKKSSQSRHKSSFIVGEN
ncbi:TPA: hypothetical protein ACSY63_06700 [Listeria monocytogenes]|nr:hypothetical protein [Listeria monocytogenes]EAG2141412.1 hypothetical protein [Listeria monocytogenes]ECC0366201.1 hypothetical protein [Listeria monocytogenes]ECC0880888.1 hypothetical protein [Listeria monocytogenes]EHC2869977.1 hypothetical protein [Listeria monocytogenes]